MLLWDLSMEDLWRGEVFRRLFWMPSGLLAGEMFGACLARRRPGGRSRTSGEDYIFWSAKGEKKTKKTYSVSLEEELGKESEVREVWDLDCCPCDLDSAEK